MCTNLTGWIGSKMLFMNDNEIVHNNLIFDNLVFAILNVWPRLFGYQTHKLADGLSNVKTVNVNKK